MFNTDLRRYMQPAGLDIQAAPAPEMAPLQFDQSWKQAPGPAQPDSGGVMSALSGLGGALGNKWDKHNAMKAAGKMYDAPMPMKRPPFQSLGPPMMEMA